MGKNLAASNHSKLAGSLAGFACPNPDGSHFNRFDAVDPSVVEWADTEKDIRRLYCSARNRPPHRRTGTAPGRDQDLGRED